MFYSARLKLTGWYLLIIMTISIAFSAFIYVGATREFDRILRIQRFRIENPELRLRPEPALPFQGDIVTFSKGPEPEVIDEARGRVLKDLIGVNLIVLILSSLSGYFLAGRTLKPIKEMVDEQNRFITDASHELRTPLTSLRTEIEVGLRDKTIDMENAKKLLKSNLEEVVSLQTLSDNLLELAQDGKETKSAKKSASLLEIVQNAIKKVDPLAKKKQIRIEQKIKEVKILAIVDRLTEVFVILLDNAIKYSPKKSNVLISSRVENDKIKVEVIDNGIGIVKEDLPHIFDRFYRANKSRSKVDVAGYGLGLSIAKKIIESHNGDISATSIPGKETKITLVIPTKV